LRSSSEEAVDARDDERPARPERRRRRRPRRRCGWLARRGDTI
jgi:hypothetical protein